MNQLSESENQPKALQAEGRNFLTIVHNQSSLMGNVLKIGLNRPVPSVELSIGHKTSSVQYKNPFVNRMGENHSNQ